MMAQTHRQRISFAYFSTEASRFACDISGIHTKVHAPKLSVIAQSNVAYENTRLASALFREHDGQHTGRHCGIGRSCLTNNAAEWALSGWRSPGVSRRLRQGEEKWHFAIYWLVLM